MWAAVTVGVISLIAVLMMMRSAVASGFSILEIPLAVVEILFLGAIFLIWRVLADTDEDSHEIERRPVSPRFEPPAPRTQSSQRPGGRVMAEGEPPSRISALADWWFNGLRDPHRH